MKKSRMILHILCCALCVWMLFTAVPVSAVSTKAVPSGLKYSIQNGQVTITDYTGSAAKLTIPDTINGYPVTSIGSGAFAYCVDLQSVTIGKNVTSIGSFAFDRCLSRAWLDGWQCCFDSLE